jgi:drug/metabolite transporter (DMT)-like permease
VCGGVLGLTLSDCRIPGLAGSPVGFALVNALVIALYTFLDGIGTRLSGSASAYSLWILLITAVPLLLWAWVRRPVALREQIQRRWHFGLAGGACAFGSYALALWAMTKAPIAIVAALRETSTVFGLGIASLLLKRRSEMRR